MSGNLRLNVAVSKAFTLIELAIVITIIGFLLAFGSIKFAEINENLKLKASAKTIVSDLRLAQQKAISRNETVEISIQGKIIKFSSSGQPVPGYFGTIVLSDGKHTVKIIISPIGRIRIE